MASRGSRGSGSSGSRGSSGGSAKRFAPNLAAAGKRQTPKPEEAQKWDYEEIDRRRSFIDAQVSERSGQDGSKGAEADRGARNRNADGNRQRSSNRKGSSMQDHYRETELQALRIFVSLQQLQGATKNSFLECAAKSF